MSDTAAGGGPIGCPDCGEPLVDRVDAGGVWVDGQHLPFRRGTDHLACRACGFVSPLGAFITHERTPQGALRDLTYEVPGTPRDDATGAVPEPPDPAA